MPPRGRPFKPGQSGNPKGRPKIDREVRALARQYTAEAIERLVFWMRSTNAKASVAAANAILDRAWGKPTQHIAGDEDGGPLVVKIVRFAGDPPAE